MQHTCQAAFTNMHKCYLDLTIPNKDHFDGDTACSVDAVVKDNRLLVGSAGGEALALAAPLGGVAGIGVRADACTCNCFNFNTSSSSDSIRAFACSAQMTYRWVPKFWTH